MNVLYLGNSSAFGGGNRVLLQLCAGIRARGVNPFSVFPSSGQVQVECDQLGLPHKVIPYHQPSWRTPLATFRALKTWRRLLRDTRAELVHANDLSTARCIALACRLEKVPFVCHVHFPVGEDGVAWTFRGLPKPAAFLFCSQALQKEVGPSLQRYYPQARQLAIQNCIPMDWFQATSTGACQERKARMRVGIVANLIPVKGHLDFLAMAQELTARGTEAEYWIAGKEIQGTGYQEKLRSRAEQLGLGTRVQFLGYCQDIADLMRRLDVVVCSSHVEPFGMCVLEAMACGRPVVASRVGGIPEMVEDGRCGFLVPPHSPVELARAVGHLLRDANLRREFGDHGRRRAAQHFSQDAYVEKMLTLYSSVAGSKACFSVLGSIKFLFF